MIRNILTAATMGASPDALEQRHAKVLQAKRDSGVDARMHDDPTVKIARINEGRWIFDCTCGSGVLTHPAWQIGRCFACGATYTAVQFPEHDERRKIELLLVQRPNLANRNWTPGETTAALLAENEAHGLGGKR
jgi:hypothetical protein